MLESKFSIPLSRTYCKSKMRDCQIFKFFIPGLNDQASAYSIFSAFYIRKKCPYYRVLTSEMDLAESGFI